MGSFGGSGRVEKFGKERSKNRQEWNDGKDNRKRDKQTRGKDRDYNYEEFVK